MVIFGGLNGCHRCSPLIACDRTVLCLQVGAVYKPGAMWAGLGLVLALCLLPGGGAEAEEGGGVSRCKLAPAWSIGEVEPMKEALGQVTVVALLQAS